MVVLMNWLRSYNLSLKYSTYNPLRLRDFIEYGTYSTQTSDMYIYISFWELETLKYTRKMS